MSKLAKPAEVAKPAEDANSHSCSKAKEDDEGDFFEKLKS